MNMSHIPATHNAIKFSNLSKPKCPTCHTTVYAAEQVLGPGSTPYHRGCLRCKECLKTLSSGNVSEHGYDVYCKICHSKLFGIQGVGYGNILFRPSTASLNTSESGSPKHLPVVPISSLPDPSQGVGQSPSSRTTHLAPDLHNQHGFNIPSSFDDQLQTNSAPAYRNRAEENDESSPNHEDQRFENDDDFEPPSLDTLRIIVRPKCRTTSGSTAKAYDHDLPNDLSHPDLYQSNESKNKPSDDYNRTNRLSQRIPSSPAPKIPPKPITFEPRASSNSPRGPNSPVTTAPSPSAFRTDGPQKCPLCLQTVYHAEQVLAIGKKWHKRCLRCWECKRALDSNLNERSGKPYCVKCYHEQFGTGSHGFVLRAGFTGK